MSIRDYRGKTAVVTGGASGIGLAIAKALVDRECGVALIDLRADRLDEAAHALTNKNVPVSKHTLDVGDEDALTHACRGICEEHDAVHLLVNAAGVSVAGPVSETKTQDIEWIMRTNFMGTVNACRIFLPKLLDAPESHIVNISSVFGIVGFANKAAYSASKFAVRGFSEALRMELAARGVGVSVLYPGPVATNLIRDGRAPSDAQREAEDRFLQGRGIPPDYVARKTLAGIQRNRARIVLSVDYRVIDLASRAFPALTQHLAGYLSRRFPF